MLLNYCSALSLPVSFISRCRFFLVLLSITLLSARESDNNPDTDTSTRINDINWSGARGHTIYWSTEPNVTPATGTAIDVSSVAITSHSAQKLPLLTSGQRYPHGSLWLDSD